MSGVSNDGRKFIRIEEGSRRRQSTALPGFVNKWPAVDVSLCDHPCIEVADLHWGSIMYNFPCMKRGVGGGGRLIWIFQIVRETGRKVTTPFDYKRMDQSAMGVHNKTVQCCQLTRHIVIIGTSLWSGFNQKVATTVYFCSVGEVNRLLP